MRHNSCVCQIWSPSKQPVSIDSDWKQGKQASLVLSNSYKIHQPAYHFFQLNRTRPADGSFKADLICLVGTILAWLVCFDQQEHLHGNMSKHTANLSEFSLQLWHHRFQPRIHFQLVTRKKRHKYCSNFGGKKNCLLVINWCSYHGSEAWSKDWKCE